MRFLRPSQLSCSVLISSSLSLRMSPISELLFSDVFTKWSDRSVCFLYNRSYTFFWLPTSSLSCSSSFSFA